MRNLSIAPISNLHMISSPFLQDTRRSPRISKGSPDWLSQFARSGAGRHVHRSEVHEVMPITARGTQESGVGGCAHICRVLGGIAGAAIEHAGSRDVGAGLPIEERDNAACNRVPIVLFHMRCAEKANPAEVERVNRKFAEPIRAAIARAVVLPGSTLIIQ